MNADRASQSTAALFAHDHALAAWLPRALFFATVIFGAALFWIAPRPPLVDLAQHAAQVSLLRDLLVHASPWQSLVQINIFTPYLIGYGLALPLSYVMPVSAAIKLVLMLAYLAFVASCVGFRRQLNGDARLDVLFVPGFFGFAFAWGFYTYLVATPFGILFMWLAHRYATAPSVRKGVGLWIAGTVLFFCHGLVFLFACAIGVGFVIVKQRPFSRLVLSLAPFVPLGLLCIGYALWSRASDPLLGQSVEHVTVFYWGWNWKRPFNFPMLVWGITKRDVIYLPLVALMLAAPWLWRDKLNADRAVVVPMIAVLLIWFLVPYSAFKTAMLYHRFAIFLLPAYALMFCAPKPVASKKWSMRGAGVQLAIIAGCWIFLTDQAVRLHRFAQENAGLETLLARMQPGERALNLVFDRTSAAYISPFAYMHQAAWYQAEHHGFIDLNFAMFVPQIVRFKPGHMPMHMATLEEEPQNFDWERDNGRMYRYFFVHRADPLPANFFANSECDLALLTQTGEWFLYEKRACR